MGFSGLSSRGFHVADTHEAHDPREGIGRTESVVDMPDAATTPQIDDEEDGDPDESASEGGYESSCGQNEGHESDSGRSQDGDQDDNMNIPVDPGGPYEVDEGHQETDWKHLCQFRRNHIQRHCFLRWNTHYNLVNNIANTWDVSRSSILQILHVTAVVEGIPDNARKVIVIVQDDDPSFDARLHVLVDVAWHTLVHFIEGPQIHRRVLRFRSLMTRRSMLIASEVGGYCQDQNDRCLVRLNGETIPLQDVRNYNIRSGHYVRIDVPPIEECRESVGDGPNGGVDGPNYGLSLLQLGVRQWSSFRPSDPIVREVFPPEWNSEMRFNQSAAVFVNHFLQSSWNLGGCRSGWRCNSFENLAPPGNPAPVVFDIGSDDEQQELRQGGECTVWDIGSDDEDTQWPYGQPVSISVSLPEDTTAMLRILQPWTSAALVLDFDPACQLLPISLQFLCGCQVGITADVERLFVFTDGSFSRSLQTSAFAFAVFGWCPSSLSAKHRFLGWYGRRTILQEDHPNFTGAANHAVDEAEASALLWALIWLLQSGLRIPCHFCFDSLNIGWGASGRWNVRQGWQQGEKLRQLAQYAEALRTGCHTIFEHVKAHSLQPGNEVVDALAHWLCCQDTSVSAPEVPGWTPLFAESCSISPWAWWISQSYFDASLPNLAQTSYCWDYHDWRGADGVCSLELPASCPTGGEMAFRLQLATYNVMTLKSFQKEGEDFAGRGAAHLLRQQLHHAGYHIIGLQETRATQQCTLRSANYLRLISGDLTGRGYRGVELWISTVLPINTGSDTRHFLRDQDATVVFAEDDLMVATVNCAGHLLIVFVCHAPYEGADSQRKEHWWQKFDTLLNRYRRRGRIIVMGDFNARLGRGIEAIIGNRLCDSSNDNGERFEEVLENYALWLPSTFSSSFHVTSDDTWRHPRGHRSRLDYIGLDKMANWRVSWSGIDEGINVTHAALDHTLVGLVLDWTEEKHKPMRRRPNYNWDEMATETGRSKLQWMVQQIPSLPWNAEVHHQWDFYDDCIHSGLQQLFPPKQKAKRSDIFSQQVWHFLSEKSRFKQDLQRLDEFFDRLWLESAWTALKFGAPLRVTRRLGVQVQVAAHILRLLTLRAFREVSWKLREQTGKDKANYVNEVVDRADTANTMEVFQELKLLRVGSKFKKMKQPPLPQIEDDDGVAIDGAARDQVWFRHCAKLEAGVHTSTQRLLQRIRKGSYTRAAQFPERTLTEAPTLLDLERSFRRIRKAKAPGHDGLRSDLCSLIPVEMSKLYFPVLAKMFFQINEPIQSKGGVMIAAFKGGKQDQIDNFRGLLLSSHTGKALRRTVRQQLQEHYARTSPDLHVSIKTGGSVSHASHALRAYQSIARQRGWSAGVLFLDVKAAYYRVIRQLAATLSNSDEDICRVLQYFDLPPEHLQDLLQELQRESECKSSDVPPQLESLVAELLSGTWFMTETKQGLCESLAGSRA